jgi:hypothetical protein
MHQMLAKGEVEEIIVRPDVEIVTIILHDGAIVKGRRVSDFFSIVLFISLLVYLITNIIT